MYIELLSDHRNPIFAVDTTEVSCAFQREDHSISVVMEDWLYEYILSEMLLQREWGWGAEGALTHPEFWASEKRTEREIWTNLRMT